MKEIHKLLVGKLKPLFKKHRFLKYGDSIWYKPHEGFSSALEIQKSQWSDDIYLNYYFFVHDVKTKPKKSDPYVTGRIYGPDLQMTNEEFNETMELSEGDVLAKTNKITEIVSKSIVLILTINDQDSLKRFITEDKFDLGSEFKINSMTHNDIEKVLGLD